MTSTQHTRILNREAAERVLAECPTLAAEVGWTDGHLKCPGRALDRYEAMVMVRAWAAAYQGWGSECDYSDERDVAVALRWLSEQGR